MILDFVKNISPVELGIVVFILVFIFGSKRIAALGKTGGETVKELKNIKKEFTDAIGMDEKQEAHS